MVIRALNDALGGGEKEKAKREKRDQFQNPFTIDWNKTKKINLQLYDPDETVDSEDERNRTPKVNQNKKSFI